MTMSPLMWISLILFLHYVGDFVLQTTWMAMNKSKSWKALGIHIAVYSVCFLPIGFVYAIVNGLLHMAIDYVTSRMSSKFYATQQIGKFWMTVGADQFLHALCLIWTFAWLM